MAKKPRKRKKRGRVYFGMDVQESIVKYNASENSAERNDIYQHEIHYAFDKLAENIINTFKFSYFDVPFVDIKNEVVAFLVMNMHKYDHTKGSKAFSYFSVVAKNYLILNNNANYKKLKSHDDMEVLDRHNLTNVGYQDSKESELNDLFRQLIAYYNKNIPMMFKKKRDIDIAYSIVELLVRREEIENFNKKSLYLLIREMTGVKTSHITRILNVMKSHYNKISREYHQHGMINPSGSMQKFF